MAYQFKNYEESDAVKQYRQQLEQLQQQNPGQYQSQWQAKQQQAADEVMNRKKFQYNMSADPVYQQYKDQYQRQGKLAMRDTIGQAAAMNGGYGSSYAQMAGQQAYNGQLQQLNDRMPELYQLALEKYQMEGQAAMDRYNLASQMESQDYGRYKDNLAAWQTERDYTTGRYDNERSVDYNMWADMDEREYSRYLDQQQLAKAQVDYLISIGVQPNEELLDMAGYNNQYVGNRLSQVRAAAAAAAAAAAGGYSGGGTRTTTDKSGNPSLREITKVVQGAASGAGKNVSGAINAVQQLQQVGAISQSQAKTLTTNIKNTQNGVNIKSAPTADELRRMHN